MWGERAGLSAVLYILTVSLVLVLPAAGSQPPRRAWLCRANPGFHLLLGSSPILYALRGDLPAVGNGIRQAASLHPVLSSDLPMLKRDPPRVAARTPPALASDVPTASGTGFPPFSFPLSQPSAVGRLLYTLSETTRRRVRFRGGWQRISTQASLVKRPLKSDQERRRTIEHAALHRGLCLGRGQEQTPSTSIVPVRSTRKQNIIFPNSP